MSCLKVFGRGVRSVALAAIGWLALHGAALAAQPGQKTDNKGGSYVASYALVLLGVGLGLMLVCRASHRRDRARPEQYDETKVL